MKRIVNAAEIVISCDPGDELIARSLGSGLGVAVYDPRARVGGLLHAMLPHSSTDPHKAWGSPGMFVDTGVPELLRLFHAAGGAKHNATVKVAGGSFGLHDGLTMFATGRRNCYMLKKVLWRLGILTAAEDLGGRDPWTIHLAIDSGRVWLTSNGKSRDLLHAALR